MELQTFRITKAFKVWHAETANASPENEGDRVPLSLDGPYDCKIEFMPLEIK